MFQVDANPYMYDTHIELIKLLKASGDFEKLHDARQRMSELFPLTEGECKLLSGLAKIQGYWTECPTQHPAICTTLQ